jgi:hypothetical protein
VQAAICVLHLRREGLDEGWFSVLVATQNVLMWAKLQYFVRVFNPTRTLFMETIRIGGDTTRGGVLSTGCVGAGSVSSDRVPSLWCW